MDVNATEPKTIITVAAAIPKNLNAAKHSDEENGDHDMSQMVASSKLNSLRRGIQHVVEQCPDPINGCPRALCVSTHRLIKTHANHRCLRKQQKNKAKPVADCKVCKLWNSLMGGTLQKHPRTSSSSSTRRTTSTTTTPIDSYQLSVLHTSNTTTSKTVTTPMVHERNAFGTRKSRSNQMMLTMRFCILVDNQKGLYTAKLV
jgi:hypothetical protein